jgi:hypothetical protein
MNPLFSHLNSWKFGCRTGPVFLWHRAAGPRTSEWRPYWNSTDTMLMAFIQGVLAALLLVNVIGWLGPKATLDKSSGPIGDLLAIGHGTSCI